MAVKALILIAIILGLLLAGCADERGGAPDRLDAQYRSECAPSGEQGVLHAWKGGKRYCFHYTIERTNPRQGRPAIVALAGPIPPN